MEAFTDKPSKGIVLVQKLRPKKDTKHLYHKCEDGSGPLDLGVIVNGPFRFGPVGEEVPDRYVTVDKKLRVWDIIVHDPSCVVAKYPPRKK